MDEDKVRNKVEFALRALNDGIAVSSIYYATDLEFEFLFTLSDNLDISVDEAILLYHDLERKK
jgi:hypothetical protein